MGKEKIKETLQEQLGLLAERSKDCDDSHIARITEQMITIACLLRDWQ